MVKLKKKSCSLVISTYNWPEALELILLSVKKQTVLPGEVIIADDGSTEQTKTLIDRFKEGFPIEITHLRQEDQGNRKSMILNKAIAKSNFDYIIQIDGDVILNPHFIEDHLNNRQENTYLYASRVNIKQKALKAVLSKKKTTFHLFSKGLKKRFRSCRLPILNKFSQLKNKRSSKFRGCNVSFWKNDFIKINGYNEAFKGWGFEDSELVQRFHNIGINSKRLKHTAIVYHLYHKEQPRDRLNQNKALENKAEDSNYKRVKKGIDQYL